MANKETFSVPTPEDISNPLFLHHSDHPGVVLVSQPLIEGNYNTCIAMIMALSAKNKIASFLHFWFHETSLTISTKSKEYEISHGFAIRGQILLIDPLPL